MWYNTAILTIRKKARQCLNIIPNFLMKFPPCPLNDLVTIQDMMRWGYSYFNASDLYYGHGYDNAWDEAQQLVLAGLYLPFDVPETLYSSRLTRVEKERIINLICERLGSRKPVAYLTNSAVLWR